MKLRADKSNSSCHTPTCNLFQFFYCCFKWSNLIKLFNSRDHLHPAVRFWHIWHWVFMRVLFKYLGFLFRASRNVAVVCVLTKEHLTKISENRNGYRLKETTGEVTTAGVWWRRNEIQGGKSEHNFLIHFSSTRGHHKHFIQSSIKAQDWAKLPLSIDVGWTLLSCLPLVISY